MCPVLGLISLFCLGSKGGSSDQGSLDGVSFSLYVDFGAEDFGPKSLGVKGFGFQCLCLASFGSKAFGAAGVGSKLFGAEGFGSEPLGVENFVSEPLGVEDFGSEVFDVEGAFSGGGVVSGRCFGLGLGAEEVGLAPEWGRLEPEPEGFCLCFRAGLEGGASETFCWC